MKKSGFGGGSGGPFKIVMIVAIAVGVIAYIGKDAFDTMRGVEQWAYSTFIENMEKNAIKRIVVNGVFVRGETTDQKIFETVTPVNDAGQWDILRKHKTEVVVIDQNAGISFSQIIMIALFVLALFVVWYFLRSSQGNAGGGGSNIFTMGKSRAKMFLPSAIKDTFNSVAGANEAKEELKDIIDFLRYPEKYKKIGAKITRGVLLTGEPGNGKTLLARAVAGEANCPFFSVSGSDFIEVFVGVGASRVRDLFAQARKNAPCIVFIDEIDAVGRQRSGSMGGGNEERDQTLNQLLSEMDGFETSKDPVIVLAATNRAEILDKALLRPGRFDRHVTVPFPDLASREKILQLHAKGVKIASDVDMQKIARGTPGFSGADLANIINEAAIIASRNDQKEVTIKDFENARDKILLGLESKTIMLTQDDRERTAYHEAGHALVRLLLPQHSDPLYKVTIVPRGRALGVTHSLPEREKYSASKHEMLAMIQSALGGRIAEEIQFNEASSGAESDFAASSRIARAMVCRYGMSSELGPIIYADDNQTGFTYSQKTAEKIDAEVYRITDECYKEAKHLLIVHKDKLDKLALALLEQETLYAREIYEMLSIEPRQDHSFVEIKNKKEETE